MIGKKGPRVRKNSFMQEVPVSSGTGFLQEVREKAFRKAQAGSNMKKMITM